MKMFSFVFMLFSLFAFTGSMQADNVDPPPLEIVAEYDFDETAQTAELPNQILNVTTNDKVDVVDGLAGYTELIFIKLEETNKINNNFIERRSQYNINPSINKYPDKTVFIE